MKFWLARKCSLTKASLKKALGDESGEANIIAIILIILVVIALVAIFREQLLGIVTGLFQQIRDALGL